MAKKKEPLIEETIEMLTELVEGQQKALDMANHLLSLKDKMIELCEEETAMCKRSNKRLLESLIIFGVMFAILVVTNITLLIS